MHAQHQSTGGALPTDLVNSDLSTDGKWHKASVHQPGIPDMHNFVKIETNGYYLSLIHI